MRLLETLRSTPKRVVAIVAVAAAVVTVPAALLAWGPDRPTYTVEKPATHNTFNSITNNPDYGDERNFVRIKDAANTSAGGWSDEVNVQPGKEYLVQMYVHNNAADNLKLVAKNTTVKASVPTTTGKSVQINGFVSASNSTPKEVWDQAYLKGSEDFNVAYVAGSAKYYNNIFPTGTKLPDSVVTNTGAKVGYKSMDGDIPGCFKYSGYVSFKIKPQFAAKPSFTMSKLVSKHGANNWVDSYAAQAGETVDYLVQYKNTGEVQQDNVTVRDTLPSGVSLVNGTSVLGNSHYPTGAKISDNITTKGVNIGSYAKNGNAWVIFSAKLPAKDKLKCGPQTLRNSASVETDYGTKTDTADVTVNGEVCKPVAKYSCDALTVTKLSRTSFKFATSYTAQNATFKSVEYVVRNASGAEIYRGPDTTYTQTTVGKYTVQAYVSFAVDGQTKTVTSDNCKKPFEVLPEDKITVCELATKKIITIKVSEFDASKHSKNLDDCKEVVKYIKVCELATKKIITINEKDFDTTKHSKNLDDCKEVVKYIKVCELVTKKIITINEKDFDATKHSKDLKDCEEVVKNIEVCELATKRIITIDEKTFDATKHSKDLKDCEEKPETKKITVCEISTGKIITIDEDMYNAKKHTDKDSDLCKEVPTELPETGPAELVAKLAGAVSLAGASAYYIASRRNG